jgi:hypothetical protein
MSGRRWGKGAVENAASWKSPKQDRKQPTSSPAVTIYTAAIDEFNKSATAFIEPLNTSRS